MKFNIIIFLILFCITKNITIQPSLFINIGLLSVVCYYYYYYLNQDNLIKNKLEQISNEQILINPQEKIIGYLNTLNDYAENNTINKETVNEIIYYTNKSFINSSQFYKEHVIKTLDGMHNITNDPLFNTIKNNIIHELDNKIEEHYPNSYDILNKRKFEVF